MGPAQHKITIGIEYDNEHYEVLTYPNEYRSLMMLIYDRIGIEGFGECLGMGKCGTCMIAIMKYRQEPSGYDRNEDTTLLRNLTPAEHVRLSCQLLVDEKMDGLMIKVLS